MCVLSVTSGTLSGEPESLTENTLPWEKAHKSPVSLCASSGHDVYWRVGLFLPWTEMSSLQCVQCVRAMMDPGGHDHKVHFQFPHSPVWTQWPPRAESSTSLHQVAYSDWWNLFSLATSVQKWHPSPLPFRPEPVDAQVGGGLPTLQRSLSGQHGPKVGSSSKPRGRD